MSEINQELVTINFEPHGITQEVSPAFTEILKQSPILLEKGRKLLADADPETADPDEVQNIINEMSDITRYSKQMNSALAAIRKQFNDKRDQVQAYYTNQLDAVNFDELEGVAQDIKVFKQDVLNARKKRRWQEVIAYFQEIRETYPDIRVFNYLSSADAFQQSHERLVNANKTWKLNDKVKQVIAKYLYDLNQAHDVITALNSSHEKLLLATFDTTGSLSKVTQRNAQLIEEDKRAEERAKQLAQAKIDKANQEKALAEQKAKDEKAKREAVEQAVKTNQPLPETKQASKAPIKPDVANSPFGLNTPLAKTNKVMRTVFNQKTPFVEDQPSLTTVQAMTLMHNLLSGVYGDKNQKGIMSVLTTPKDVIDALQIIINQVKE